MQPDSPLSPKSLKDHLDSSYGLVVIDSNPIGKGETALLLHVQVTGGKRYFIKIYLTELFSSKHDEIQRHLKMLDVLASEAKLSCVLPPIRSRAGELLTFLDDTPCALFPYIEGKDLDEEGLSAELLANVGETLGQVHQSIAYLPEGLVTQDSFWMGRVSVIRKHLKDLEHSLSEPDEILTALWLLIEPYQESLLRDVETTEQLAMLLKTRESELVLTHGDAYLGNIRRDNRGNCYLLDWDMARLAPRERDLHLYGTEGQFIYDSAQAESFLSAYSDITGVESPEVIALAYYRYKRYLEDTEQRLSRILGRKYSHERAKHAIEEVRWFLRMFQLSRRTKEAVSHALQELG